MTATRKLDIVVNGKDEASSKLKKMSESIQSGLKKVSVAAGLMGAALVAGLNNAIDAAIDAERAQRQLETAIISLSGGTKEQVASIDAYATSLEKKIGLDADALKMGTAQLGTFQLQSDSVEKLTKSVADLTINNHGLTASSDQYIQSANTIAKALDGQFGVLEEQGVKFTEAQQQIILFGTESEKVAAIQEGLTQNLRETTETVSGLEVEKAKLTQTMGEVSEKIGTALMPIIQQLIEKILPIIQSVADWIANNQELTIKIIAWTGAILAVLVILPMLVTGIGAVGTALMFLTTNPIGMAITAIAGLITIIVLLITHWDEVKAKALEVWNIIKEHISQRITAIKEAIGGFIENVKGKMSEFMDNIREAVANGMEAVKEAWSSAWDAISGAALAVVERIKGFVQGLIEKIKEAINQLKNLAQGAASNLLSQAGVTGGSSSKRASGGNVFPGNVVRVGEQGPEDVVFGQSGRVIPNSRIGGGGVNLQVVVSNNTVLGSSIGEFAEMINNAMIDKLRLQTKLA